MAIMHLIDRKQLWFLLIVGALFAGTWMRRDKQDQTPTTEMLDAQLLEGSAGDVLLQADEHTFVHHGMCRHNDHRSEAICWSLKIWIRINVILATAIIPVMLLKDI